MQRGTLGAGKDVLLNTQRGAYTAISVVGLLVALLLGVSFAVGALIAIVCGIQRSADR